MAGLPRIPADSRCLSGCRRPILRHNLAMRLLLAAVYSAQLLLGVSAADLARGIGSAGLDPAACYRVRDISIVKEDARLYLTDGYLIFGKEIEGARISAVFTAEVEGGDAEVLLMPPTRSERRSLASYTGAPNLDEHFDAAVLIF